ncbi:MAG: DUF4129 domain-containing protein [Chthoniobacteraceae bacterium]
MNRSAARFRGQTALQLVEEAVRVLRGAPATVLMAHFFGSAPCMLYAVYFFTDLSRGAFGSEHLIGESLTFAALYGWMKCWQAVSAAHLHTALLRQPPPQWNLARVSRLVAAQCLLQPIGLVLRFAASAMLFPYVWTATFFQNVTVLGDGSPAGLRELCADAWREAKRWPKQAHALTAYLTVFGFFVYVNFTSLVASGPVLLKSFFGIETVFSHYSGGMLNPTFLVAMYSLTYLFLDPIRKAIVALRCFRGRSILTGEDLAVELKQVCRAPIGAVLVGLLLLVSAQPTVAAMTQTAPARVDSSELNRSIDDVLERREFTWRGAREKAVEKSRDQMNGFERWLSDLKKFKERMMWQFGRSIGRLFKKIGDWFTGEKGDSSKRGDFLDWLGSVRVVFWVVAIAAAAVLAVLVARRWRLPSSEPAVAEPMLATPDLREESVTADQLPEDGWLQLARELLDRGELRLALRAFYLAGLAHLGSRELIRLAKHKSNRDYNRELRRRARTQDELIGAFDRNLDAFERAWYGDHPVTTEGLGEFSANLERIRSC